MDIDELKILIFEQAYQNTVQHERRCHDRLRRAENDLAEAMGEVEAAKRSLNEVRSRYLARVPA